VKRVKDLNGRLQDIRREQVFQRVGLPFQRYFVLGTFSGKGKIRVNIDLP